MAVAALVLGIICVLVYYVPFLSTIMSILAIVFGALGRKKPVHGIGRPKKGIATAGMVLGIIGAVLSIFILIVLLALGAGVNAAYENEFKQAFWEGFESAYNGGF